MALDPIGADSPVAAAGGKSTLNVQQVAQRLVYGDWNGHGGDGWELPVDLDAKSVDSITVNYSGLTKAGQWFAKQALASWSAFTGFEFKVAGGGNAQIIFDDERSGANTKTYYYPNNGEIAWSEVNISRDWISDDLAANGKSGLIDSFSLRTYIHEIGHALGIGHPGDYHASDGSMDFDDAEFANDSWQMTVMSYFDQNENTSINATKAYLLTPMIADAEAIEMIYGATGDLRKGATVYGKGSTAGDFYDALADHWKNMAFTIVDDGGEDTVDFSNTKRSAKVDLAPGAISSVGGEVGNMLIAEGTLLENFRSGKGNDTIRGNGAGNLIEGGAGKDRILGLSGRDKLFGDGGNDVIKAGSGKDLVRGGAGKDKIFGDADADKLFGDGGNDKLMGGAANDRLYGGNGRDLVAGGSGDDRLWGGKHADTFRFTKGDGHDIVKDWEDGTDQLDLRSWKIGNFDKFEAKTHGVAGDLEITLSKADVLVIAGVDALDPGDVLL